MLFPIKAGLLVDRTIGHVHAVDDVSFTLHEGETLGIVGESGCGKTTLIRALVRLLDPTGGAIRFRGADITKAGAQAAGADPPRDADGLPGPAGVAQPAQARRARSSATPLRLRGVPRDQIEPESRGAARPGRAAPEHLNRFPHEFSGGQRQRIGIARALAVDPKLIMLDEPVSALDVSIQAQVINLLDELQDELHLTYVFVAHDLSVVRHVSDRIAVMYLGKIMELSPAEELYDKPIHPYTSALLGGDPDPRPGREPRPRRGRSSAASRRTRSTRRRGCRFHTRCPRATDICRQVEPQLTEYAGGHLAACHHPQNVTAEEIAAATRSEASPLSAGELAPEAASDRGEPGKEPLRGSRAQLRGHGPQLAPFCRCANAPSQSILILAWIRSRGARHASQHQQGAYLMPTPRTSVASPPARDARPRSGAAERGERGYGLPAILGRCGPG